MMLTIFYCFLFLRKLFDNISLPQGAHAFVYIKKGFIHMEIIKIPGLSLGLIALALQNAYSAPLSFSDGGMHKIENQTISVDKVPYTPTISVSDGTSLDVFSSDIKTSSVYAFGILSTNSGNVTVNDAKIYSSGNLSYAVAAKDAGVVNISNSELFSDKKSYGAALSSGVNSKMVIEDSKLTATSSGSNTVQAAATTAEFDGNLEIKNSEISTSGEISAGIFLQQKGTLTLENSSIKTTGNKSSGIMASLNSRVDAANVNINTAGDESNAVNADTGSVVSISRASIETSGNSIGINAINDGTVVSVFDSNITTSADAAKGVWAGGKASLLLTDTNVLTNGKGSYAVSANGSGSRVVIENGVINTTGEIDISGNSANAVVSEFGGDITMNGQNSVSTTGAFSAGLLSQVSGENLDTMLKTKGYTDVLTTGNNAAGVLACSSPGVNRTCITPLSVESDDKIDANSSLALLSMDGGKITTHGNNSYGAYANGVNAEIALNDISIVTNGQESHALAVQHGNIAVSNSNIATTGTDASIAMINKGGILSLNNVIANAKNSSGINMVSDNADDDATVNITNSKLNVAFDVIATNNASAQVDIENSNLTSEKGAIINNNGGVLNVNAVSTLLNGYSALSNNGTTNLTLSDKSIWNIKESSALSSLDLRNSDIFISKDDGNAFRGNTLTVNGDFRGENGTLHFRSQLNDDSSLTDKLVVKGNTSGTTNVVVTNAGGSGAYTLNGIEIISVDGNSEGNFVQASRIVAGAHEYSITRGGSADTYKNWYLTNFKKDDETIPVPDDETPVVIRPEGASYIANLAAANTMFVTRLNDRAGETRYINPVTGETQTSSLWLRQIGGHNAWRDSSSQLKTTANRYVTQLGGDIYKGAFSETGSWRVGVMAGFARSDSTTRSTVSGINSKGSVKGYSSGLYATWFENDVTRKGSYLDSWVQYSWFDNDVKGDELDNESYKSKGATASIEAGYAFSLNEHFDMQNTKYEWLVQPQAQVTWMGVKQDSHFESNGTRVDNQGDNNIQSRVGLRTYIRTREDLPRKNGTDFEPYVEMNWINNSRLFGVTMDGVNVQQSGARNLGEIKAGINGNMTPSTSIWGNVGVQIGDNGYNDTAAMIGLKYKF